MRNTYDKIISRKKLMISEGHHAIQTIDMHTGGEPLRVIIDGFPELPGLSVLARRKYLRDHYDHLRRSVMFEPRGHKDMYGCLLVPPNDKGADFGIIFMHNEGYSTMCGHAIIAISILAVKMGWIEAHEGENELMIDAPCGRISSFILVRKGKNISVRFHNVPSFVVGLDRKTEVPGLGTVIYDLAYGGAFYAYVDMAKNTLDFDLTSASSGHLTDAGMRIKKAVIQSSLDIKHPKENELSFLYGTIFTGPAIGKGADSRNVCIFADGELDRSPTGSGVSGRMAIHYLRNEIGIGEWMHIESITGSRFSASVLKVVDYGPFRAVIPVVEGTAYITGMHTFILDHEDPLKGGFLLGQ